MTAIRQYDDRQWISTGMTRDEEAAARAAAAPRPGQVRSAAFAMIDPTTLRNGAPEPVVARQLEGLQSLAGNRAVTGLVHARPAASAAAVNEASVQRDPISTEDPESPQAPITGPAPAPAPGDPGPPGGGVPAPAPAPGVGGAPATVAGGSMAAPVAAPETHPDLKPGDGPSVDVGVLQQKLNGAGAASPPLRITAVYSEATTAAVISFKTNHGLPSNGETDQATWTELEKAAPSVVRNGRVVVDAPGGANALGVPAKGITHPTIRRGSKGAAVEELQQRLNNAPPSEVPTMLEVDGKFGPITRQAVLEFQGSHPPLVKDGVVGPATWGLVDLVPGSVNVGRVEFSSDERVEGNIYGGDTRYTWRLTDTALEVTVNINFTGLKSHPQVATWLGQIASVWNVFKFVDDASGKTLKLTLNAARATPGDNDVRVYSAAPGTPQFRSNSGNWNVQDPDIGLAPHEFGHLIGLQDEYRNGTDIYRATTGEEGVVGEVTGDADPAVIAGDLWTALNSSPKKDRAKKARKIISDHKLVQGAFAQRVAEAYELAHAADLKREDYVEAIGDFKVVPNPGGTIDLDIAARLPGRDDEAAVTNPFTYTNRSLMGNMQSLTNPRAAGGQTAAHDHPIQERHVRHFLQLVQANRAGSWRLERGP